MENVLTNINLFWNQIVSNFKEQNVLDANKVIDWSMINVLMRKVLQLKPSKNVHKDII